MIIPAITTHYSLLNGFIKPDEAAKKCKELGYTHCLLADNSLSGVVDFFNSMKKQGVVPIIGWKADGGHYIVKTLNGYKSLIRLVSGEDIIYRDKDLQFYNDGELDLMEVLYAEEKDSILLNILLCSKHKTTLKKVNGLDIGDDRKFFETNQYYFKKSDISSVKNIQLISELEDYSILCKPKLPKVDCGDMTESDYLTELCREGWRKKFSHLKGEKRAEYGDRVKEELGVITGFELSGYFLIVQDIVNFVRKKGWLPGPGRGCFLPETMVKMTNEEMKAISEVVIGDIVVDAYGKNQKVYNILEYDINEDILELEFENGKIVRCTVDHKFLTKNRGWVEAQNLTEFDDIAEV